jgi:hypothetical protein
MYNINFGDIINIGKYIKDFGDLKIPYLKISFAHSDPLYLDENEQENFYQEYYNYETDAGQ